ncbi:MAG: oligoendopeptidase F family protein [Clostridia bacterium]|nr:oligoendopeptidase F family protein [Clostridia bacterium]
MERKKQEEKFIWRIEDIYPSLEAFVNDCDRLKLKLRKLEGFKGKLNNPNTILNYLNLEEEMERSLEKIIVFSHMKKSTCGAEAECAKITDLAQDVSVKAGIATSFAGDEISKLANDQLRSMAKDPAFANFKRSLELLIRNKPHIREENIEKLVSHTGSFSDFESIFQSLSDIEMPIADIVLKNGKHLTLNNSNYSKFLHSPDRFVREQAYNKLYEAYKKLNLTYSGIYLNACRESNFITQTYNFKTTFERHCFYDEADVNIVNVLLKSVKKALPLLQRMQKIRKKALKIDDYSLYDIFAPLAYSNSKPPKYYYTKAEKTIKDSLKVMGEDYITLINHALHDRWVDLYPAKNKDSSCYCISCYDVHPFVLTNYNNTAEAVSTLSHELGHAMQSYLAGLSQPFGTFECSRLTCEIASTVNEILTKKYIIDSTTDPDEKIAAIDSLLGDFYGAIYKQSLYTEFEMFVFSRIESGESVTFEDLNKKYYELLKEYFGNSVQISELSGVEWSRIPHFYSPFYVYKYVVGFASAINICSNLLSGEKVYKDNYLEFLKSGSSKSPKELLKLAGIDLLDEKLYDNALQLYSLYIDELEALLKEKK